ncbi:MAG: EAL domain-containing protein [Gammaproteobacteria bacterium]|nr:EAL domain-containing protein [Gammaproteobacteria bacterium]
MLKLRSKIQILGMAVVAVTVSITIAPVLYWALSDADERIARSLEARGPVFELLMEIRERSILTTTRLAASALSVERVLETGDRRAIDEELRRQAIGPRAVLALLTDTHGEIVGNGGTIGDVGTALQTILNNATDAGMMHNHLRVGDVDLQTTTVHVPKSDPPIWLTLGWRLDDSTMRDIRRLTGLQATLLATDESTVRVVGSTLDATESHNLATAANATLLRGGDNLTVEMNGQPYRALQGYLIPDSTSLVVLLKESIRETSAAYSGLRLHVLSVASVALLLALFAGSLLARHISDPVARLVAASRRIREGDYAEGLKVKRKDEFGELATAFNAMQEGIAEREERIIYQAQFDELTGLPNRLKALEKLREMIALADTDDESISLLVVDLNSFSDISSSLGHEIGDAVLSQAAERMRASLDAKHVLARLEADDFLVILKNTGVKGATRAAEELMRLLGAGLSVQDVNVGLDASIGICCYPEHGEDAEKLLLRASVAKHDAKSADERIHLYEHGREARHVRQLSILGDLRRAVNQDELKLFLQPKIRLNDNRVCGAEALVRWDHPTLGFLMPNEFIDIAEQSGNISLITDWALAAAIRECRLWHEEGLNLDMSVNLSGRDLQNPDLPFLISELLRDHDLTADYLVLEITEQALVRDLEHASRVLGCLRDLGARIAIDDFGTGYSSLVQVKNLPVDEIKIDRSFVMELPGNRADVAIVRSAIELSHNLGMEVLAEGVESRATLRWLAAHGCERAQGFHIARPMPAEQFGDWLRGYEKMLAAQVESGHAKVDLSFAASATSDRLRTAG